MKYLLALIVIMFSCSSVPQQEQSQTGRSFVTGSRSSRTVVHVTGVDLDTADKLKMAADETYMVIKLGEAK